MVVEIRQVIKEYAEGFVKRLYNPPKTSGFTIVVMSYAQIMYHSYSKNKTGVFQSGVLKARTYYEEGHRGMKVFVFDHSTGTLDEIGFSTFYQV
jgi:hypothetical protein